VQPKKKWYTYTMEYYSAIKNEIISFAGKLMELEIIMLSEITQTDNNKYCMFSHMQNLKLKKTKKRMTEV
jgi:hypothetical protein